MVHLSSKLESPSVELPLLLSTASCGVGISAVGCSEDSAVGRSRNGNAPSSIGNFVKQTLYQFLPLESKRVTEIEKERNLPQRSSQLV